MALTLMYITNSPQIARIAQQAGVDRVWVDMEYIGKEERQKGMNTVKSHHTIDDVRRLRPIVITSELMVRVNPIHEISKEYYGSEQEIEMTIDAGADVIMLPMFTCCADAERFIRCIDGRAKNILLLETAEAAEKIDEILMVDGIDEIHIGLNDLHLAYKKKFMFELLCDGTVCSICKKINKRGIKYGFGGIARVGYGMLPAEYIIAEHYALGSTGAILSRGFCDANSVSDPDEVKDIFTEGVRNIRLKEVEVAQYTSDEFEANHQTLERLVGEIVKKYA